LSPSTEEAETLETRVHIAGEYYPVTFADTNLSNAVKQRITSDLAHAFSITPSFEDLKGSQKEKLVTMLKFKKEGGYITSDEYEKGRKEGVFSSDDFIRHVYTGYRAENGVWGLSRDASMFHWHLNSEGILIIDKGNDKRIQIDKVASDKYQRAFAWIESHPKAMQAIDRFITQLNSTNLLAEPIYVLREVCYNIIGDYIDINYPPSDDDVRAFFTGYPSVSDDDADEEREPFIGYRPNRYKCVGTTALSFAPDPSSHFGEECLYGIILSIVDKEDPSKIEGVSVVICNEQLVPVGLP